MDLVSTLNVSLFKALFAMLIFPYILSKNRKSLTNRHLNLSKETGASIFHCFYKTALDLSMYLGKYMTNILSLMKSRLREKNQTKSSRETLGAMVAGS